MSEPVKSLEAWLGIATDKLTQAGKERITLEIASHFGDAVVSYRADGLTEADAQARALADLGGPKKAARRFRKRHLTQSEAEFLEKKLNNYLKWRKPWTQGLFWIVLGCLYYLLRRSHASLLSQVIWTMLFVAQSQVCFWFANRSESQSLRIMLATDALGWLSVSIFMGCIDGWRETALLLLVLSWKWLRVIHLWLKLRRLADVGQEMRPPGAVAS